MIKKLVLAVLLMMFFVSFAYGDEFTGLTRYNVNIRNLSPDPVTTQIPITTIRPDVDKIVGVSCVPLKAGELSAGQASNGNTECFVSLFDSTSLDLTGECLGEMEKDGGFNDDFDLRPRKFSNQITVRQGAYTEVQIFFITE